MIAMTPTITLKGTMKFSLKKALIGGDMSKSQYTGPGELLLAPASIGDITIIKLGGHEQWSVGKDAFLACTQGIVTEYKSQGVTKAMFSGEGLFVYKISGQGILWCTSFGAIIKKDVSVGCAEFVVALTDKQSAAERREVHHRQRSPRCMELQVRPRARCIWRHCVEHDGWRRFGLQVHWAGNNFHADQKCAGIRSMARCQFCECSDVSGESCMSCLCSLCNIPQSYPTNLLMHYRYLHAIAPYITPLSYIESFRYCTSIILCFCRINTSMRG
jgi:hypothetical protein